MHIAQDGKDQVAFRSVSEDRREVYSVSETFTSVAIGIARAEGLLDLDDSVLRHLANFIDCAASGVEDTTIRHLLRMTAGIDYRWDDPDTDHPGDRQLSIMFPHPRVCVTVTSHYEKRTTNILDAVCDEPVPYL